MRKLACAALALMSLALPSSAWSEVTKVNFSLDTTRDLIALCDVEADDPNAMAAIHMCHGYVMGLTHFHIIMGRALDGTAASEHAIEQGKRARPMAEAAWAQVEALAE